MSFSDEIMATGWYYRWYYMAVRWLVATVGFDT